MFGERGLNLLIKDFDVRVGRVLLSEGIPFSNDRINFRGGVRSKSFKEARRNGVFGCCFKNFSKRFFACGT